VVRLRERARVASFLGLLVWLGLAEALPLAHVALHAGLLPHAHWGTALARGADVVGGRSSGAADRRAARCHIDATEGAHCHARAELGRVAALRLPGPDDGWDHVGPPEPWHGDGSFEHHAAALLRPVALGAPLGLAPRVRLPPPVAAPRLPKVVSGRTPRARGPPAA
jgi:hypothetical protein